MMAVAAILKTQMSWYLKNHFTNFDEIWHSDASGPSRPHMV